MEVLPTQIGNTIYVPAMEFYVELDKKESVYEGMSLAERDLEKEELKQYFLDFFQKIVTEKNPFNYGMIRRGNVESLNLFYEIGYSDVGVKITTKHFVVFKEGTSYHGRTRINLHECDWELKRIKIGTNKIKEIELQKKLAKFHFLINNPLWISNRILLTFDMNQQVKLDLSKDVEAETRRLYPFNMGTKTYVSFEQVDIELKKALLYVKMSEMSNSIEERIDPQIIKDLIKNLGSLTNPVN